VFVAHSISIHKTQEVIMKRHIALAVAPAAAALIAAGCGSAGSGGGSASAYGAAAKPAAAKMASAAVRVRTTQLGPTLVGSSGRTLYVFEKDKTAASTCNGACASVWPPLTTTGNPHALAGIAAAKLGTTKRQDGETQVTYAGHPVYYYVSDTAPGQVSGQGLNQFGAEWHALAPSGKGIQKG
jgi:predicted lipoprotein with Yx(FWY)xxD motif